MKVIISHHYSNHNKGDAALLSVLLNEIRQAFGGAQVTILTVDNIEENTMFEGVPIKSGFMYHIVSRYKNRVLKFFYSFFVMGITIAWACWYRLTGKNLPLPQHIKNVTTYYRETDLIITVGGGYVLSGPKLVHTMRLVLILHPLIIGYIIGKPTIMYAQSVGPFGNKFQAFLAKCVLKKMDLIIVREEISMQLLKKLGITQNIVRSIDRGFLFSSNSERNLRKELKVPDGKLFVGITVRKWLQANQQAAYEREMAKFTDQLIEQYHAVIVFISQVTVTYHEDDDREVSKKIYDLLTHKEGAHVMMEDYDHSEIKAIYSTLDYTIGTRFHSVIFSLTSYVPAIAIEYEHKTSGIMQDLGLNEWVIKIEDITAERLMTLFKNLIIQRALYIERLQKVIPEYIASAAKLPPLMKKAYERHTKSAK